MSVFSVLSVLYSYVSPRSVVLAVTTARAGINPQEDPGLRLLTKSDWSETRSKYIRLFMSRRIESFFYTTVLRYAQKRLRFLFFFYTRPLPLRAFPRLFSNALFVSRWRLRILLRPSVPMSRFQSQSEMIANMCVVHRLN